MRVQHPADRLAEGSRVPGGIVRCRLGFIGASLLLRVQTERRRDLRGEVRRPPDIPDAGTVAVELRNVCARGGYVALRVPDLRLAALDRARPVPA